MNDSRIVTAPDLDLDARFKILLVDCEWSDIERLSTSINSLDANITLFLYGSNDTDDTWCINTNKHAYATIVNCRFTGSKEILKGYLLAQKNTWALGQNEIGSAIHRNVFDIYSWMLLQYNNYLKEENNGTQTRN
jgi:hypothetical protein